MAVSDSVRSGFMGFIRNGRLGHVRLDEGGLIDFFIISGEIRQVRALGKEHRKTSAQ